MSPNHSLNRRTFLKLTSGVALAVVGSRVTLARGVPGRCEHCEVELAGGKLVTRAGKCRNCGAEVWSGDQVTPKRFSKAQKKEFRNGVELPFPHPEIREFTVKPCGALKDVRSRKSRVRKTRKKG